MSKCLSILKTNLTNLYSIFFNNNGTICFKCKVTAPPPKSGNNISCLKKACQKHIWKEKQQHCQDKGQLYEEEEHYKQEEHEQQQHECRKCKQQQITDSQPVKHPCIGSEHGDNLDGDLNNDFDDLDDDLDSNFSKDTEVVLPAPCKRSKCPVLMSDDR